MPTFSQEDSNGTEGQHLVSTGGHVDWDYGSSPWTQPQKRRGTKAKSDPVPKPPSWPISRTVQPLFSTSLSDPTPQLHFNQDGSGSQPRPHDFSGESSSSITDARGMARVVRNERGTQQDTIMGLTKDYPERSKTPQLHLPHGNTRTGRVGQGFVSQQPREALEPRGNATLDARINIHGDDGNIYHAAAFHQQHVIFRNLNMGQRVSFTVWVDGEEKWAHHVTSSSM